MVAAPSSHRAVAHVELTDPEELRRLAAWYRDLAYRAGDAAIWEARLRTAEDLEAQADQLEGYKPRPGGS